MNKPLASFAPVLVAGVSRAVAFTADGEIVEMPPREMARHLGLHRPRDGGLFEQAPPILCHAPATARRLGVPVFPARDALELFAFVCPAKFCLPTPRGLADALGLTVASGLVAEAEALQAAVGALLDRLAKLDGEALREAAETARVMARAGWAWGPECMAALNAVMPQAAAPEPGQTSLSPLRVWMKLKEWQDEPPPPPPSALPVAPEEARERLADLVGHGREARPQQSDYAAAASDAFAPRDQAGEPRIVLAEAGTGTGKTLGYIAPASLWAEKNKGAVWLSTYTRNLQRQLDTELDRLHPDPLEKASRVVIRKGRENYICLLNLEEQVNRAAVTPRETIPTALMTRWARATRDGDMVGGDFPSWLAQLMGYAPTLGLADRRGECIYAACDHWRKCFIEKTVRRARHADIVVANHALVMAQAALTGLDDANVPTRYVFDEGHHLFDAADSAFAAHLGGRETAEMRRWLLGAETTGGRPSRARGLQKRIGDLFAGDVEAEGLLADALRAARALPGDGWQKRLAEDAALSGNPRGATENFLALIRQQVIARAPDAEAGYSIEAEKSPLIGGLAEAAVALDEALIALQSPIAKLGAKLARFLDEKADELDTATRQRIEGALKSLERRAAIPLAAWRAMLATIDEDAPPDFADWFSVERLDGREVDVGLHRHWVDPTVPFARDVLAPSHGALITSATLRDSGPDRNEDWTSADARSGAKHLPHAVSRIAVPSPFDYPNCTRVLVVTDVAKANPAAVASAYRSLFLASGGGALGLFTSIARLRDVHSRIAPALEDADITLLAQHVDGLDTGTLVDIFRAEEDSCLLGTDAVRDGVDVPGRALRLIVFDRVPWPRPDILHKARRQVFGGKGWDEALARFKLKQAYGRLIRRAGDTGVFVMLDSALPSRLAAAFPPGVTVQRLGLADAVAEIRNFFANSGVSPTAEPAPKAAQDTPPHFDDIPPPDFPPEDLP
ncbi:MAG TPA: ATP-dependent DNA helicase [Alphaproteobacteria bacterium]|nr:ATP-dependent DNA helicase [Alphaproteobacteria bacterium]